jgi:threonine synthase
MPSIKDRISGLRCLRCTKTHSWEPRLFVCPDCLGNLEVLIETQHLHGSKDWIDKDASGIWRYKALLPVVSDLGVSPLLVGGTPLVPAPAALCNALGIQNIFLKDDTRNPSASFKDRASAVALAYGVQTGAKTFVGASTGNAGSSMACLAASLGEKAVIFVPKTAPQAKLAQILLFGAQVIKVDGTYDDAFDLCSRLAAENGWYNRNTGQNPYTREGKKTVAFEIWEQLGYKAPDILVVPVGDGNIISGAWKGFKELFELGLIPRCPRIFGIQSEASNAVAKAWERWRRGATLVDALRPVSATTIADSISVDMPRDGIAALNAIIETDGQAIQVSDQEILESCSLLARTAGVFAEPAAGAAIAGLSKLRGEYGSMVALITGSGLKDVASLLKVAPKPMEVSPDWDGAQLRPRP